VGLAVDSVGNLYAASNKDNQIVKLAAGSSTTTVLPFNNSGSDVAVDSTGNLYVTGGSTGVLKLTAGSYTPTELPFTGLHNPNGLAVDTVGNVYVADQLNDRVVKLPVG
jgi:serine/threonine-protein kinase